MTTLVSTITNISISNETTITATGPYGNQGLDIGISINPLFFASWGPLQADISSNQQPVTIPIYSDEYSYTTETTTTETIIITNVIDQYDNIFSTQSATILTAQITGIYQNQTFILFGNEFNTTGSNMCGIMAPC